jgi:hypothetical protein
MKHKKITEIKVEEIKRELQGNQRSNLEEREDGKQELLGTTRDGEQKPNAIFNKQKKKWKLINKGSRFTN